MNTKSIYKKFRMCVMKADIKYLNDKATGTKTYIEDYLLPEIKTAGIYLCDGKDNILITHIDNKNKAIQLTNTELRDCIMSVVRSLDDNGISVFYNIADKTTTLKFIDKAETK